MKRIIPYILILSVLVGILISALPVQAASCTSVGSDGTALPTGCVAQCQTGTGNTIVLGSDTQQGCKAAGGQFFVSNTDSAANTAAQATAPTSPKTEFQTQVEDKACGIFGLGGTIFPGCVTQVFYGLFYQLPAWLLLQTAYFFNVLISVTLSGALFKSTFVSDAWRIVRDLSNIFFILVLLYVAIKIILDLGGHEAKKMIARVILMALLINFSMFFTQVVVDSSNILALIFYNKLQVDTSVNGVPRPYASVNGEKDVSGGMVAAFDPTTTLQPNFFDEARKVYINGKEEPTLEKSEVPASTLVALILIAGLIMGFAIYALFISGLSFVGRLIELWICIIFSPFAFMSFTIPLFGKLEYIGWDAWLKRLLTASFMAPIFMFFLYFIFLLINSNIFTTIVGKPTPGGSDAAGVIKLLLGIILPTLLILILLLQATKFAKKGGGVIGGALVKGGAMLGGMATGVALGAATGGVALLARNSVGRMGNLVGNAEWTKKTGALGRGISNIGKFTATRSFDLKQAPGIANLAKRSGINLGAAKAVGVGGSTGGFAKARADKVEKRRKRAQALEVGEDGKLKQHLNTMEADLQGVLNNNIRQIEKFDQDIRDAKETNDPVAITAAINAKKKFVNNLSVNTIDNTGRSVTVSVGGPGGLKDNIFNQKASIIEENRSRKWEYAEGLIGWGGKANREAAHKIRMEEKLDAGEKH